jgi:glutamate-1-semialdehyde aminotransferase
MTEPAYAQLGELTRHLGTELEETFRSAGVKACVVVAGSIFRLYFLDQPPANYRQAAADSGEKHRWFSFWMLNHGIATRQGGAPSLPMTTEHAQQFIDETRNALKEWPF